MALPYTNWAGNIRFGAARTHRPATIEQLQELVAASTSARALGSGHSFSPIADTHGDLIQLDALPPTVQIDPADNTVTVAAAVTYAELAARLEKEGFALPNMASLPHISVAGACATGTHGSGNSNGSLATAVTALDMLTADGSLVTQDLRAADFPGMVVALGALGIVTSMTLRIGPAFTVRQWVYENLSREHLVTHVDEIFAAGYSVSVFTDWRHASRIWVKQRGDEDAPPPHWLGAHRAQEPRHPVPGMPAGSATQQLGMPGPWHERLPHFRPEFTPSSGDELQSEYLVPRDRAADAITALTAIADQIAQVLLIAEIRTVAADDLWLSMAYGRDSVAFHFTWRPDTAAVLPVLAQLEERLAPFDPRPHWGKLFTMDPRASYDRLPGFTGLLERFDPAGKFRNDFVARTIG
jgi:alditol oxidase